MQIKILLKSRNALRFMSIVLLCAWLPSGAWGVVVPPLGMFPLNQVPIPEPLDLQAYVKNKAAAIQPGTELERRRRE